MKIKEGYMPYLEYKTYYRIVGFPGATLYSHSFKQNITLRTR